MSLQKIINQAETINFDRRQVVGIQYSRSEIAKVSETPTRNPWRINVGFSAALPYDQNRDLIEALDTLDRANTETITFSANPNLSWLCAYQGELSAGQLSGITVSSFTGNQLVLGSLPTTGSSVVLFKAGDFIQIGTNPYPFTVVNTVTRGSTSTVTVTTHRPNFITTSTVGSTLTVGNAVQFKVFCPNMPTYTLVQGASRRNSNGTLANNAFIQFSSGFELYEWTGDA